MNAMRFYLMIVFSICTFAHTTVAQIDEIIVTARKIDELVPGVFLTKTADFMLLEVRVINDSIEPETRGREINQTLDNLFTSAATKPAIELSINQDGVVLPLNQNNKSYRLEFSGCAREDTICTSFLLKTPITGPNDDAENLIAQLEEFSASVKLIGRTKITHLGNVDISLVDPHQYRGELLNKILDEIKSVMGALGDGHRVKLDGFDKNIEVIRSGILDVSLYIPYSYTIYPDVRFTETTLPEDY